MVSQDTPYLNYNPKDYIPKLSQIESNVYHNMYTNHVRSLVDIVPSPSTHRNININKLIHTNNTIIIDLMINS